METGIYEEKRSLSCVYMGNLRLDGTMCIHMCGVVGLSYERTRTHIALERFCAAICVGPMMLLEIPLCAEQLIADCTRILLVGRLVCRHVCFDA